MNTSYPRPTLLLLGAIAACTVACKAAPPPPARSVAAAAPACEPPECPDAPESPPCSACVFELGTQATGQTWTLDYKLDGLEQGVWAVRSLTCANESQEESRHTVFSELTVVDGSEGTNTATISRLDSDCPCFNVHLRKVGTLGEDDPMVISDSGWIPADPNQPFDCSSLP